MTVDASSASDQASRLARSQGFFGIIGSRQRPWTTESTVSKPRSCALSRLDQMPSRPVAGRSGSRKRPEIGCRDAAEGSTTIRIAMWGDEIAGLCHSGHPIRPGPLGQKDDQRIAVVAVQGADGPSSHACYMVRQALGFRFIAFGKRVRRRTASLSIAALLCSSRAIAPMGYTRAAAAACFGGAP
jgi:hypothetical protein